MKIIKTTKRFLICLVIFFLRVAASAFSSGQGIFHIFESVFKRSTFSDLVIAWGGSYCICNNYSINSRAFCMTSNSYNPLMTLLQANTIIDPQLGANPPEPPEGGLNSLFAQYETQGPEEPVDIGFFGPTTAIDNAVRSRAGQSGFVFSMGDDGISVGNHFTAAKSLEK